MNQNKTNDFLQMFRGRFIGMRTWAHLDALWDVVRREAGGGWYVYAVDQGTPTAPMAENDFLDTIAAVDTRLHDQCRHNTCGFVYVDDPVAPAFIKVFEPRKFGGCCHGTGPAIPSWIFSKLPPVDLLEAFAVRPTPGAGWRKALFSSISPD
ncbi:MAG: hypothetical protein HQL37_11830 [Alphaproteobacteria bacterium]|nr:hypothetical protein [Alphaproteobacteria bacterium]